LEWKADEDNGQVVIADDVKREQYNKIYKMGAK
jgi:hypothetical protein